MPLEPDLSLFGKISTKQDFDRLDEEWRMKKAIAQAELKKSQQIDVDKLGEQAFMKAAMGAQLSPEETAAAQFIDAKSGGVMIDPYSGNIVQKPRLSDRIKIGGIGYQQQQADLNAQDTDYGPLGTAPLMPVSKEPMGSKFDMGDMNFPSVSMDELNQVTNKMQGLKPPVAPRTFSADSPAYGNQEPNIGPNEKATLDVINSDPFFSTPRGKVEASKAIIDAKTKDISVLQSAEIKKNEPMTESQSSAATYADRMKNSHDILSKLDDVQLSISQRGLDYIPLAGNFMTSEQYKMADQAQRDFVNAVLRRESGAVISPQEFNSAKLQYFPQPGDTPAVIRQKKLNRETSINGIARAAGPKYTPPTGQGGMGTAMLPKKGEIVDGYMFSGGNPNDQENWKKVK